MIMSIHTLNVGLSTPYVDVSSHAYHTLVCGIKTVPRIAHEPLTATTTTPTMLLTTLDYRLHRHHMTKSIIAVLAQVSINMASYES